MLEARFKGWTHANYHLSSATCFTWYAVIFQFGSRKPGGRHAALEGPHRLSELWQLGPGLEDPDEDVRKFKFKRLDVVLSQLQERKIYQLVYVIPIYLIPRRLGTCMSSYSHW